MDDIKQYEPLWGSWYIDSKLGEGSFGKVYKVHKEEFGKTYYAAVKMISIPQSEADIEQARSEMPEESVPTYFREHVVDIVKEIDFMSEFKGNTNIVSLEDHEVVEKKDAIHWDILIRMELLTTLSAYMNERPLTQEDVIQMGMDIARALELCAMKKTIHRDIKPANIFVSQYGDYKLGDFGVARQIERTVSGMSIKGTYSYIAPEIPANKAYGPSVDLYSLGIVMYRYLNNNRLPFEPAFPETVTTHQKEEALRRRLSGENIPDIPDIDPELNAIILKACAYNPDDRYRDATEFRTALEKYSGSAPKPPAQGTKRAPIKAGTKKPRAMRDEDNAKTMGVFVLRRDEHEEEVVQARPEVPQKITNVLSITGAALAFLLALLCLFSGRSSDIFISMPIFILCTVICVLNFKHSALNAVFLIWLVCHLLFSTLMKVNMIDYSMLVATLGVLSVESMRSEQKKYNIIFSIALVVCAGVSALLAMQNINGSSFASFRASVFSTFCIPLMMITTAGLVLLPKREDGKIIAGLTALQFMPLIAFIMLLFLSYRNFGRNILLNIVDSTFVGFSEEKFSWWTNFRILGLLIQTALSIFLVWISSARFLPEDFLGFIGNKKKNLIVIISCLILIAVELSIIAFIPSAS